MGGRIAGWFGCRVLWVVFASMKEKSVELCRPLQGFSVISDGVRLAAPVADRANSYGLRVGQVLLSLCNFPVFWREAPV